MELFDVVFPLNLGPLTYKGSSRLVPGMLVNAEIKNTIKTGLILRQAREAQPLSAGGKTVIKEISSPLGDEPALGSAMLKLIPWMSDYYFVKEGIVLKEMWAFLKDAGAFLNNIKNPIPEKALSPITTSPDPIIQKVMEQIKRKSYKTFLLQAPSIDYEMSMMPELINAHRNILIICPEIKEIKYISGIIEDKKRLSVFHSGLSKKLRQEAAHRILSSQSDIVIGSRSAVFAPLSNLSLMVVFHEESPSYKKEDGLRYHTRDIAIMRSYIEGATALLTSLCPSVESFYNAKRNKYTLVSPEAPVKRPRVRLIDMRVSKKVTPFISKPVFDSLVSNIKNRKGSAFLVNRKGYGMLKCEDCGHIEGCMNCRIPLVFYKEEKTLKCHYCGFKKPVGDACSRCKGANLKMLGAGIERIQEDIKTLLEKVPLMPEGPKPRVLGETEIGIIIGTRAALKTPELKARLELIALLSGDAYLAIPDFRSTEKAFQELLYLTQKAAPQGEILIQTRMPHYPLFKYIKNYDFDGFYNDELSDRKALFYPPFSKMALIITESAAPPVVKGMPVPAVDILGPIQALGRKGQMVWKVLIKARSREELHKAVKAVLKSLKKENSLTIDIDPISI